MLHNQVAKNLNAAGAVRLGAVFEVAPSQKQLRSLPVPLGVDARRELFKMDRVTASQWASWGLWVDGVFRPLGATTLLLIGDVPGELRLRVGASRSRGGDFGRRFRPYSVEYSDPDHERPAKRACGGGRHC